MAEVDFERRLERLFMAAPDLPDSSAFAERVDGRLNRGWTARRWLIGAAGLLGGIIGASQLFMSNILQRVESAEGSARLISSGVSQLAPKAEWLSSLSSGGVVVWVAVALAVVMMGFVLSRVIEEF
jgi:hypothetical protein